MGEGEGVVCPVRIPRLLGEVTHLIWEERGKELEGEVGIAGRYRKDSFQASSIPGSRPFLFSEEGKEFPP